MLVLQDNTVISKTNAAVPVPTGATYKSRHRKWANMNCKWKGPLNERPSWLKATSGMRSRQLHLCNSHVFSGHVSIEIRIFPQDVLVNDVIMHTRMIMPTTAQKHLTNDPHNLSTYDLPLLMVLKSPQQATVI